jgi:ribosomal protein S18 acetylase RimI-like enzyme
MELHVAAGNESAILFYEKSGYASAGLQKDFYGKGLDGTGYWKALG